MLTYKLRPETIAVVAQLSARDVRALTDDTTVSRRMTGDDPAEVANG